MSGVTMTDMPKIDPIQRLDVSEATYQRVRDMILLGDLRPGSKIDLDFLARSLRVSRTTIANALQRLQLEDLVQIVSRRGTFVRTFTSEQVQEIYEVRLCLELWAAEKAVAQITDEQVAEMRRILTGFEPLFDSTARSALAAFAAQNRDFHTYLINLARNGKTSEIYRQLNIDLLGYRIYHIRETSVTVGGEPVRRALRPARMDHKEHQAIVQAYEARDGEQVGQAISHHLRQSLESHLEVFEELNRGA